MKTFGARSSDDAQQEIVIRPDHVPSRVVLIVVMLAICSTGARSVVQTFTANALERTLFPFYTVLLLLLGFTALWVVTLLQLLFGSRVIHIRDGLLTIQYRLGVWPIGRPTAFSVANIQGMRIEGRRYAAKGKSWIRYAITLEYLGQQRELVAYLSKQRAESLLNGPLRRFVQDRALT